jgi:hypothetical protein
LRVPAFLSSGGSFEVLNEYIDDGQSEGPREFEDDSWVPTPFESTSPRRDHD